MEADTRQEQPLLRAFGVLAQWATQGGVGAGARCWLWVVVGGSVATLLRARVLFCVGEAKATPGVEVIRLVCVTVLVLSDSQSRVFLLRGL